MISLIKEYTFNCSESTVLSQTRLLGKAQIPKNPANDLVVSALWNLI